MELRHYWNVIWRRWPVVLALPLLVALGSLGLVFGRPASYTAEARVQLVLVPQQGNAGDFFRYDDYYNFLATEYTVDDLVEVLSGNVFTEDVARTLQGPGFNHPLGVEAIRGSLEVTRKHRVLHIAASSGQREWAVWIAQAAIKTLQDDPVKYFSRGDAPLKLNAVPLVIEQPLVAKGNRVRGLLNAALQTLVAFFAGLGLAFLLDYLDDSLRGADAVRESLGLPVLAQLPAVGSGLARGRR